MRRLLMGALAVFIVATGAACSTLTAEPVPAASPMNQQQQLVDQGEDLRHLGYAFEGMPVVETSAAEKKAKYVWNSKKKKWEKKTTVSAAKTEHEAAFMHAGCRFEADRLLNEKAASGFNNRRIEHFTIELEDGDVELEFDNLGAHTPQQAVDLVKYALSQPHDFKDPPCFTGRV